MVEASAATTYKLAKEAFHADNAGSSIMSINAVSLTALSCYALYAAQARARRSLLMDYITMVLPLLLGITLFARQVLTFNGALLCIFGLIFNVTQTIPAASGSSAQARKSKGKWLEESDSDEEPSRPAQAGPSRTGAGVPVPLPSEVIALGLSTATSPSLASSEMSPRARPGRTGSRTPEHTAINVLPTPEMVPNGTMAAQQATYPTRTPHPVKDTGRLPFLSVYRAHMMVMTVLCILAVDFSIFPRWFGKCETYGTSLMDIGVGSFVFSLGVVSVRSFRTDVPLLSVLWRNTKKALPIVALGMVRVIMVKGVEYPEHVTEYGVHWNFFFTLALMPLLAAGVWPFRIRGVSWTVLGALVTIWHQATLSTTTLESWVLSPIRTGLVGQNKEGLVSLPGYLAIYLLGLATGQHILRAGAVSALERSTGARPVDAAERYRRRRTELALELFGYAVAWWAALIALRLAGLPVSRRMANLPYVVWTAAYNVTFLLGYLVIEAFVAPADPAVLACPPLLEAVNKNGLAVFLVANLLTGAVNVSMQTMYARWFVGVGVLLGYSVAVCGVAWVLRGWSIKL